VPFFDGDVVERAPAGEVRRVRMADVSAVLMPAELHALLGRLHHVLFVKEIGIAAQRGPADVRHQVAENKLRQVRAVLVTIGDEVAPAAVIDADDVAALPIHLGFDESDVAIALAAQHLEMTRWDDGFEDEIAFLVEVADVFWANHRHLKSPEGIYISACGESCERSNSSESR